MTEPTADEVRQRRFGPFRLAPVPVLTWQMLCAAIWLVVGLAINASATWLYQSLWILAAPIFLAHALVGLVLAVLYLLRVLNKGGPPDVVALCAMLVLLPGLALLSMSPILGGMGDQVVFTMRKPHYERVIADIAAGRYPEPFPWSQDNRIGGYSYDSAQPPLVVFRWYNGIPDGGSAIVYDVTDSVMQLGPGQAEAIVPRLEHLLTGDKVICKRFAEPHYLMCHFS